MLDRIVKSISAHDSFALFTHVNPDGDALGSCFALAAALRQLGKKAVIFLNEPVPDKYQFLNDDCILSVSDNYDIKNSCVICLDCASRKRLGVFSDDILSGAFVINIDHHVTNEGYGNIDYVEKRSATGELVFEIISALGVNLTPYICNAVYTAIFTDTGRFSYEDTEKSTFLIAAELCGHGLDIPYIANNLYASRSFAATQLIKKIIENMRLFYAGRVCVTSVALKELAETGADISDCETVIDYAREISGVEIAVFIREMSTDYYKVSFRSKTDVDVAEIASVFGGGGHRKAAGCAVRGEFYDVRDKVLDILKNYV